MAAPAHATAGASAPDGPGAASHWTTGAKDGIGTSTTTSSKVWFSLGDGTMNEVYYPRVDVADTEGMQLVVTDGRTFTDREDSDTTHRIRLVDQHSLTYQQIDTDKQHRYRITKTYVADPKRASVVVDVQVTSLDRGRYTAYVLYDPSLANSGMHDSASTDHGALLASDRTTDDKVASALVAKPGFTATSNGYSGTSDGWTDLATDHRLDHTYTDAPDGNVVQVGRLAGGHTTLVLGFGADAASAEQTAKASLTSSFTTTEKSYESGWAAYLKGLKKPPTSVKGMETQYDVAVMSLKAHEDKTYRGANIASLTVPWGEASNADQPGVGGYHLVWARDLYQIATAQLAAGDSAAADRSLDYLFDVQQKPDGSFPQNTRLDGTPYWGSLQLDEVAFPIVLADTLGRTDRWANVKRAADFLVGRGPSTPQERWEEESGYSPSTIAAEIAGLVSAADLARQAGDTASEGLYLATADDWRAQVKKWTFTTTGPLGDGRYFERIDDNGNPDDGHPLDLNNGGGTHDERDIVDAGFLDLVRLGVFPADDPEVTASLPEVDATISVQTPEGRMWYRYDHDGYGEKADGSPYDGTGVGRLWPLLSGERGEYALAAGQPASSYLKTMAGAANDGYMIPEQVWDSGDQIGRGTGSATPLSWSMAQFVRLAQSIDARHPVETPKVVAARYSAARPAAPNLALTSPDDGLQTDAASVTVAGSSSASEVYVNAGGTTATVPVDAAGHFSTSVDIARGRNVITVAAVGADGGTAVARRTVVSTNLGTPIGSVSDPAGDDNGPGSYVYPASPDFTPGAFDVTKLAGYEDPTQVNFAVTINGALTSPWGGNAVSLQRFDLYVRSGSGTGEVAALPGTNAELAAPYDLVVTADGWNAAIHDASGANVGTPTLAAVPETHTVVISVPRDVLPSDLSQATYALTTMSHADEAGGEGVGGIRPVYSKAYWDSTVGTDQSFVHDYRFGGGAGEWTSANAAKDTDSSDPNVLDILVPPGQSQSTVLDWTAGPVVLPYVGLG
ncbi:MAG: glucan 1,4-alpha-glucosidase [Nocardioides sp.]|nr:glucan 1,4-alpha-glucosidase [Nocardioides sp.]